MKDPLEREEQLDKLARRGVYCLVMGVGAFFVYLNEMFGWVRAPDYPRLTDAFLPSLWTRLDPYMPLLSVLIGVVFLSFAGYYFYQYSAAESRDRPAA